MEPLELESLSESLSFSSHVFLLVFLDMFGKWI